MVVVVLVAGQAVAVVMQIVVVLVQEHVSYVNTDLSETVDKRVLADGVMDTFTTQKLHSQTKYV